MFNRQSRQKKMSEHTELGRVRFLGAQLIVLGVWVVLLARLWHLQVFKSDYYAQIADRNRLRKIEIPAERGVLYDRFGQVLLGNRPFHDLIYIPQYVTDQRQTLKIVSKLLHIPEESLLKRINRSDQGAGYVPIVLKRNLSMQEVSVIETNRIFLPGVEVQTVPRRDYNNDIPSHLVGYLAEIDNSELETLNQNRGQTPPYRAADLIGKQGIEKSWENFLRGQDGSKLIQVDAYGRRTASLYDDQLDQSLEPAIRGHDIELTLDLNLQREVRKAFTGKVGSVVVMDPRNGEILALLSEPGYDLTMYQRRLSQLEWQSLITNPFKPLLDKSTGGEYIPGSIYKAVVALAGLQEGVITEKTTYDCPGHFTLGRETFNCWEKAGHGKVDLAKAIYRSCDVFFYNLGILLGPDAIAKYAFDLGLGQKLGLNLNFERPGLVPTTEWKKSTLGKAWTTGDTPNIAIGQGFNLLTPLQMAALYANIAMEGKTYRPHLVRRITNTFGQTVLTAEDEVMHVSELVDSQNFKIVKKMLQLVVEHERGTAKSAAVQGQTVAGKTGSAQVVSLEKNQKNTNDDVSFRWKEHAIFASFAPVDKPEIVVIIVSENDAIGGGGAQAAPVAGTILKAYFEGKKRRETVSLAP